ncbi:MAG: hypothetical protein GY870_22190 [archaeon]|nr:hypothetical protein [archaeon]
MTLDINEIEKIAHTLKESLETDFCIIDKYGFILSSTLKGFKVGEVISPTLFDFIKRRGSVSKELNTKEISSMLFSISKENFVLTFGDNLILMSKVPKKVDLDEYLPSIKKILGMLDKGANEFKRDDFVHFDVSKEIKDIESNLGPDGTNRKGKYKIFAEIIKKMNKLRALQKS